MEDFKNKVMFITGAAHGFGEVLAKKGAHRGMKIAMADIDEPALTQVYHEIQAITPDVLMVVTDVTKEAEVDAAIAQAMTKFGRIDLLINDAGVAVPGMIWDLPSRDWEWIIHTNLMSQVYTMQKVIPIMRQQKTHGAILNVASYAGLVSTPLMPAYYATKFASVGMTEGVAYDLQQYQIDIEMHVFCPAFVQTDLYHCEQHRPAQYTDKSDPYYQSQAFKDGQKFAKHDITTGMPIDNIANIVFTALEQNQFYILSHPSLNPMITKRTERIVEGKGPDINYVGQFLKSISQANQTDH